MKKFYALLVACIFAFAANAQNPTLYLRGSMTGSDWPALEQYKFSENNGVYTLKLDKLTGSFKISTDPWNDSYNYGTSTPITLDTDIVLDNGGGSPNMSVKDSNVLSNVTLTFTLATKTLRVTGTSSAGSIAYDIWGCLTSSTWAQYELTETNGKWVGSFEVTYANAEFGIRKMANGSQTDWYSASDAANSVIETGKTYNLGSAQNFKVATGSYTFTFDPTAMTLAVSGTQTGETPGTGGDTSDKSGWWFNLKGNFNGWADNGKQLTAGSTILTWEDVVLYAEDPTDGNNPVGTFQIKIWDGKDDSFWGTSEPVQVNTWTELSTENGTMTVAGDAAGKVYTVKFDTSNNSIYVESTGEETYPEVLYMLYAVDGMYWNLGNAPSAAGDGVYTFANVKINDVNNGSGYFQFSTKDADSWEGDFGTRYAAATGDTPIVVDLKSQTSVIGEATIVKGSDQAFMIEADNYDFEVNLVMNTLSVLRNPTTGVENLVNDENAPVEYFNLQGVRVANPAAGQLVIKRQGTTVSKVLVK